MDPNNNLEPVIDTAALEAAMADMNPAASVADAAMGGATPVVTTTDDMASDVAPEPTLQAPTPIAPVAPAAPAAPVAPETPAEGPVSLAPSADFQMSETATVSALQNGADGNLAAANAEIMIGQPLEQAPAEAPLTEVGTAPAPEENTGMAAPDFSNPDGETQPEQPAPVKAEEDDEPLVAAAPVPGSIGSAKSYADIQRAEAEKAAKMAAKTSQKGAMDKKTIIIIAAIAAVVVAIVAIIIIMIAGNKPAQVKPTPVAPVEENHEYSTLSCKRNLAPEEYASYGAISGIQENIFYFQDDELDGLVTNFAYTYANKALSDIATENFKRDYGVTEETEAEAEDEEEEEEETEKTTAEMLKHYVTTKDYTVTHGMEIKSEDIKAWLESDAYSDVTYGAIKNSDSESEEEVTRNLKFYNRLQNSINYTCTIDKSN